MEVERKGAILITSSVFNQLYLDREPCAPLCAGETRPLPDTSRLPPSWIWMKQIIAIGQMRSH